MDVEELCKELRQAPFSRDFSAQELAHIARAGKRVDIAEGETLMEEGKVSDALIVLLGGAAEVVKRIHGTQTRRIAELGPGAVLGEIGLLNKTPRSCTVRSIKPCQAFVLGRDSFDALVEQGDAAAYKLALAIARVLASRLENMDVEVVKLLAEHESVLDLVEGLVTQPDVSQELFQIEEHQQRREDLGRFKEKLLTEWNF